VKISKDFNVFSLKRKGSQREKEQDLEMIFRTGI